MFICNCIKKDEDRGYKNVTLKTIMNTTAHNTVKKITHVPLIRVYYESIKREPKSQVYLEQNKKKGGSQG